MKGKKSNLLNILCETQASGTALGHVHLRGCFSPEDFPLLQTSLEEEQLSLTTDNQGCHLELFRHRK